MGDFYISINVDKNNIEQNEGVNATIKITGSGNFDDIDAYKLDIKNANIYSDKPVVKSQPTMINIEGEFIQKFSISSNEDFSIPSLSITYYDAKNKKVITKKTKPIDIHVKNSVQEKPVLKEAMAKEIIVKKESNYLNLFLAFIAGILSTLFILFIIKKREYKLPKFKNDKDRLKILLKRRGESEEIDGQISELENRLYKKSL